MERSHRRECPLCPARVKEQRCSSAKPGRLRADSRKERVLLEITSPEAASAETAQTLRAGSAPGQPGLSRRRGRAWQGARRPEPALLARRGPLFRNRGPCPLEDRPRGWEAFPGLRQLLRGAQSPLQKGKEPARPAADRASPGAGPTPHSRLVPPSGLLPINFKAETNLTNVQSSQVGQRNRDVGSSRWAGEDVF